MASPKVPHAVASQSRTKKEGPAAIPKPPFIDERSGKRGPKSPTKNAPKKSRRKLYTFAEALDEAFLYEQHSARSTRDLQRVLRSITYLLVWSSDTGNEAVPGHLAYGLTEALDKCTADVADLFTWDDIFACDGNPREILNRRRAIYGTPPREPR